MGVPKISITQALEASSTFNAKVSPLTPVWSAKEKLRGAQDQGQSKSFEAVCRAVGARLGIGMLPLAAALSFAPMNLRPWPLHVAPPPTLGMKRLEVGSPFILAKSQIIHSSTLVGDTMKDQK